MSFTNRLSKSVFCFIIYCLSLWASPAAAQTVPLQGGVCNAAVGSDNSITGQARPTDSTANSMSVTGMNLICDGSHWQYPAIITGTTSAGGTAISCATATAGAIEWTGSALQYCNGTSWTSLGGSGGSITGSGTTNYVARWTSSTALGTGVLYDNGTNVGIGTTSPQSMVQAYNGEVQVGSSGASCTSSNAGAIRYSSGVMQYCNGSAWSFFSRCTEQAAIAQSAYPGCCGDTQGIYSDGTYIYNADHAVGLIALSFNGTAWTSLATQADQTQGFLDVTKGGGTIFTAEGSDGIRAFTFNGSAFTQKASISSTNAQTVWSDGTNVFVADGAGGLRAYSYNGSAFTLRSTYAPSSVNMKDVWSDGTYVYATDFGNNVLYALSYTSNTLSRITSVSPTVGTNTELSVVGDGTYIYTSEYYQYGNSSDIEAYTFNGSSFNYVAGFNTIQNAAGYPHDLVVRNNVLYAGVAGGIEAIAFSGTSFSLIGEYPTDDLYSPVAVDANYIYTGPSILYAYPICH